MQEYKTMADEMMIMTTARTADVVLIDDLLNYTSAELLSGGLLPTNGYEDTARPSNGTNSSAESFKLPDDMRYTHTNTIAIILYR